MIEIGYAKTPPPPTFSLFLSRQLTKIISLSYNQKSLMKPDTFDSKPSPSSCYAFILSIVFLICLSIEKLRK